MNYTPEMIFAVVKQLMAPMGMANNKAIATLGDNRLAAHAEHEKASKKLEKDRLVQKDMKVDNFPQEALNLLCDKTGDAIAEQLYFMLTELKAMQLQLPDQEYSAPFNIRDVQLLMQFEVADMQAELLKYIERVNSLAQLLPNGNDEPKVGDGAEEQLRKQAEKKRKAKELEKNRNEIVDELKDVYARRWDRIRNIQSAQPNTMVCFPEFENQFAKIAVLVYTLDRKNRGAFGLRASWPNSPLEILQPNNKPGPALDYAKAPAATFMGMGKPESDQQKMDQALHNLAINLSSVVKDKPLAFNPDTKLKNVEIIDTIAADQVPDLDITLSEFATQYVALWNPKSKAKDKLKDLITFVSNAQQPENWAFTEQKNVVLKRRAQLRRDALVEIVSELKTVEQAKPDAVAQLAADLEKTKQIIQVHAWGNPSPFDAFKIENTDIYGYGKFLHYVSQEAAALLQLDSLFLKHETSPQDFLRQWNSLATVGKTFVKKADHEQLNLDLDAILVELKKLDADNKDHVLKLLSNLKFNLNLDQVAEEHAEEFTQAFQRFENEIEAQIQLLHPENLLKKCQNLEAQCLLPMTVDEKEELYRQLDLVRTAHQKMAKNNIKATLCLVNNLYQKLADVSLLAVVEDIQKALYDVQMAALKNEATPGTLVMVVKELLAELPANAPASKVLFDWLQAHAPLSNKVNATKRQLWLKNMLKQKVLSDAIAEPTTPVDNGKTALQFIVEKLSADKSEQADIIQKLSRNPQRYNSILSMAMLYYVMAQQLKGFDQPEKFAGLFPYFSQLKAILSTKDSILNADLTDSKWTKLPTADQIAQKYPQIKSEYPLVAMSKLLNLYDDIVVEDTPKGEEGRRRRTDLLKHYGLTQTRKYTQMFENKDNVLKKQYDHITACIKWKKQYQYYTDKGLFSVVLNLELQNLLQEASHAEFENTVKKLEAIATHFFPLINDVSTPSWLQVAQDSHPDSKALIKRLQLVCLGICDEPNNENNATLIAELMDSFLARLKILEKKSELGSANDKLAEMKQSFNRGRTAPTPPNADSENVNDIAALLEDERRRHLLDEFKQLPSDWVKKYADKLEQNRSNTASMTVHDSDLKKLEFELSILNVRQLSTLKQMLEYEIYEAQSVIAEFTEKFLFPAVKKKFDSLPSATTAQKAYVSEVEALNNYMSGKLTIIQLDDERREHVILSPVQEILVFAFKQYKTFEKDANDPNRWFWFRKHSEQKRAHLEAKLNECIVALLEKKPSDLADAATEVFPLRLVFAEQRGFFHWGPAKSYKAFMSKFFAVVGDKSFALMFAKEEVNLLLKRKPLIFRSVFNKKLQDLRIFIAEHEKSKGPDYIASLTLKLKNICAQNTGVSRLWNRKTTATKHLAEAVAYYEQYAVVQNNRENSLKDDFAKREEMMYWLQFAQLEKQRIVKDGAGFFDSKQRKHDAKAQSLTGFIDKYRLPCGLTENLQLEHATLPAQNQFNREAGDVDLTALKSDLKRICGKSRSMLGIGRALSKKHYFEAETNYTKFKAKRLEALQKAQEEQAAARAGVPKTAMEKVFGCFRC